MNSMVIIGAGECGTRAAFALREHGWIGPVTLLGAETGLPYERPPLSKPVENGQVRRKLICEADALVAADISYLPSSLAIGIDPAAHLVTLGDGRQLPYDRLLLATGARPRRLACPGADLALDFRTHDDVCRVYNRVGAGSRIAIIGAGLIGMELAAVLRCKGHPVDVIEAAPLPLGRAVPRYFARQIHERHEAEGVNFHFGAGVGAIDRQGVVLSDGRRIPADLVISAIGVLPETALAEGAGLAVGNGIMTDSELQTSARDIFAAGDCAAIVTPDGSCVRLESWRNARDQAETAAGNMIGASVSFHARPWFWSDQYNLGLQVAGVPEPADVTVLRQVAEDAEIAFYLRDGRLVAAAGLGPGNSVAKDIRLAEMLIAVKAAPDPGALTDPSVNLKSLLKTAQAA